LVRLTRAGKAKAVIDDLVITAFVLDETAQLNTPKQITEALYLWFEQRLAERDVKESVNAIWPPGVSAMTARPNPSTRH
jgi:hypothetical protein